jgi:hypothetical protein
MYQRPILFLPQSKKKNIFYTRRKYESKYLYNKDQEHAIITFSFIPVNNLYMFRVGLLVVIRRYDSVYTAVSIC